MAPIIYVIQEGDTLTSIAEKQCGDVALAAALAGMNRLDTSTELEPGGSLILDCYAAKDWHPDSAPLTPGPETDDDGTVG